MKRCPDCDHLLECDGKPHNLANGGRTVPDHGHDEGGCWQVLSHTGGRYKSMTCPCITAYVDGKVDRGINQVA